MRLGAAASRDDQLLVYVDAVGVANRRICGGQAGPSGGSAELGSGQAPQSVTFVDFECLFGNVRGCGLGASLRRGFRKIELSAGANLVGVGNAAICGEEFRPAIAVAQILFRQFPEGIAALNADSFLRAVRGGWQRALRLYRANRIARRDKLRTGGLGENARRRGPEKYPWQGGNYHPRARTKIWTDIFVKVRGYLGEWI